MAEWSNLLDSVSREPGSIPVSALLTGFFALPTRKSTLTCSKTAAHVDVRTPGKRSHPAGVYQR